MIMPLESQWPAFQCNCDTSLKEKGINLCKDLIYINANLQRLLLKVLKSGKVNS